MNKRISKELDKITPKEQTKLRLTLGICFIILLCSFAIVIATFTELNIPKHIFSADMFLHPIKFFTDNNASFQYIPQIPVILFIAGLFGVKFGLISVLIYILVGLFGIPVFAGGGGLSYVKEFNFGYILAYIPTLCLACKIIDNNITFKKALQAAFLSVLLIHLIGIIYMVFIVFITKTPFNYITEFLCTRGGLNLLYDFIFGTLAILVAKPINKLMRITLG